MNFLENFQIKRVQSNQKLFNLSYLDFKGEPPKAEIYSENDSATEHPTTQIQPKILQFVLEDKTIQQTYITNDHTTSNLEDEIKNMIKTEAEIDFQFEVFYKCLYYATYKNKYELPSINWKKINFIKEAFWNFLSYYPKLYIGDDYFFKILDKQANEILETTKIGRATWICINPKAIPYLQRNIKFTSVENIQYEPRNKIPQIGFINNLSVYATEFIPEDQVLMGRSTANEYTPAIMIIQGHEEWIKTEYFDEISFNQKVNITFKSARNVSAIPGAKKTYTLFDFQYEKPSLTKYLLKKFKSFLKLK